MEKIKLKKISMAGFRSYGSNPEQNTIELNDINILIGANGAGKSNFISFLEMVGFIATGALQNYIAKNGYAQAALHFGPKVTESISGQLLLDAGQGRRDRYGFELAPSATGGLYFAREEIEFDNGQGTGNPYKKSLDSGGAESQLLVESESNKTAQVLLHYLRGCHVFHFNDTSLSSKIRGQGYAGDSQYLRADGGNLAAYLYAIKNTAADQLYYERILRYVKEAFPQLDDLVLEPTQLAGADPYIQLRWKAKGEDEILGPHQLSDGTLRFIALTVLLLQPSDKAPWLMILDEPEIGLHPYAIRLLGKMIRLASKTAQILVSTQSPQLLNEFDCEDVLVTEYDGASHSSSVKRLSEESLSEWLEEYSLGELWEKNILGGTPR